MTVAYVGPCCVGVDNNNPFNQGGDYVMTHYYLERLLTNSVVPDTVDKNPFSGSYGALVPELADSWEVSSDQLTWTFKLHPGITWDDGTPFTADDVKFSFELCVDPKIGVPCYPSGGLHTITGVADVIAGTTQDVSGIKVVDPVTVTFTTDTPNALLPYNVDELPIVQKASVGQIPREEIGKTQYWNTPNDATGKGGVQGTGPFMVSAYSAGVSMELSPNGHYWRGKPLLDHILRREFKDTATALLAYDAGQVDVTYLNADDVEREQSNTIGTVLPGPSGADLALVLNPLIHKEWADPRVHQAFLSAIDRKSILTAVYHIANPQLLNCIYLNPAYNPTDVSVWDYNPDKAKQLLKDAGVDPASWGEIVFDSYYNDPGSVAAMTAIQSNLADVGIKVKVQAMDSASWSDRYYGKGSSPGTSELSMIGSDGGYPAGGYGFQSLHSSSAYPKGGNGWNGYHYSNPQMDKALEAVQAEFDPAKRATLLQDVCRISSVDQPYINMWATTRYWAVSNRIANFIATPGPGMGNYYNASETWFIRS